MAAVREAHAHENSAAGAANATRVPQRQRSTAAASTKDYRCEACKHVYPHGQHMPNSRRCQKVQKSEKKKKEEEDVEHCHLCLRKRGLSAGRGHTNCCVQSGGQACCNALKAKMASGVASPAMPKEDALLDLLGLSHASTAPPPPVVIFGGPGVGKSYLTCALFSALCVLYCEAADAVVMLAAYGVVAQNVGGITIHAWAGLSVSDESLGVQELVERIRGQSSTKKRWMCARVILIDDASLVEC